VVVNDSEVGYDALRGRIPAIIYYSLSEYGPYRERVGPDLNYPGFAGL
jgi:crotonobetainyl-CoA:carnitine CoA-transferase CaiB-like acyl-CoA transferase